ASRAVVRGYDQAIAKLGSELSILQSVPVEDIARAGSPLLAEAITRLRAGQVICEAGYDGEYGVIRLFEDSELKQLTAGGLLFDERGVAAATCLAITFTRRAAAEMRQRLSALLADRAEEVPIHTFHSLGLAILREHASAAGLHRGFRVAGEAERIALLAETLDLGAPKAERLLRAISREKRTQSWAGAGVGEATAAYGRAPATRNWI